MYAKFHSKTVVLIHPARYLISKEDMIREAKEAKHEIDISKPRWPVPRKSKKVK